MHQRVSTHLAGKDARAAQTAIVHRAYLITPCSALTCVMPFKGMSLLSLDKAGWVDEFDAVRI